MDEFLLQTNAITKEFKNIKAVDHIDLKLKRGEVYGLIGRNGAGKTTLLRMLAGLAQPTEGNYTLFGLSGKKIATLRDRVGVLIEAPGLFGNMNAMQNMKVKAMALGLKEDDYIRDLLSSVGLSSSDKRPVRDYSLGMKQRLGIAMALIGHPDLLLLDEPINGLDPEGIIEVRELLDKLSKEQNITILISSHILEELSKTATRFGIINRGRLISEFTREELYEECRQFIEIKTEDIDAASTLIERMGISDFKIIDKTTLKIYEKLDAVGSVISELENNGVKVISVDTGRRSLEEYYISLVDRDDKVTAGK